jgi:hypothetical protein
VDRATVSRVPAELSQRFLDEAVARLRKVTPRKVRLRSWTGAWAEPLASASPLVEPWEPEPPERTCVWIEVRLGRTPLHRERIDRGIPLPADAEEVLEAFLGVVHPYLRPPIAGCESRVEIGADQIRWWYERDGERVLELEPLPRELLGDDSGEGGGGAGVREPRRPLPHAPSAADAVDPAA